MDCSQYEHDKNIKAIMRLKRIEGQLRGIVAMLEQGRDCDDVITQLSSASAGITAAAREILFSHIEHCVVDGVKSGDDVKTVENLRKAVQSFAKLK